MQAEQVIVCHWIQLYILKLGHTQSTTDACRCRWACTAFPSSSFSRLATIATDSLC